MTPHTRYRAPDGGIWRVGTAVDAEGRHEVKRNSFPSVWLKQPRRGWVRLEKPWGRRPVEHTADSLLAMTEDSGDCSRWTGYMAASSSTPYVSHGGEMRPVRRLLAGLLQLPGNQKKGGFWASRCGDPRCVAVAHLVRRNESEHARSMNRALDQKPTAQVIRAAKIAAKAAARRKLTDEQIEEIMTSEATAPEMAAKFGVSRALVSRYRRGELGPSRASSAMAHGNPWAWLMAA